MSRYTTGEIAKLCGVTVRTVQYYDTRGILVPSELTEGGRRLYSEEDVKRLSLICFLRELGLSIDSIGGLLKEEDPGSVITILLDQQAETLAEEIREKQESLKKVEGLRQTLKSLSYTSVDSIGDAAKIMKNRDKLKKLHLTLVLGGLPLTVLQWVGIILWITRGKWQVFALWALVCVPWGIWMSRYYISHVAYICPQCHTVFTPGVKEALFAAHTPRTRKLTCTCCGHHGYCVEDAKEE